jgi:hypothetical protein
MEFAVIRVSLETTEGMAAASAGLKSWPTAAKANVMTRRCT